MASRGRNGGPVPATRPCRKPPGRVNDSCGHPAEAVRRSLEYLYAEPLRIGGWMRRGERIVDGVVDTKVILDLNVDG